MMSPAVSRGRVHWNSFVTPFVLLNDVSICDNREVISTSGFAAMFTLTVGNISPMVAIGQMLMSWRPN